MPLLNDSPEMSRLIHPVQLGPSDVCSRTHSSESSSVEMKPSRPVAVKYWVFMLASGSCVLEDKAGPSRTVFRLLTYGAMERGCYRRRGSFSS